MRRYLLFLLLIRGERIRSSLGRRYEGMVSCFVLSIERVSRKGRNEIGRERAKFFGSPEKV